MLHVVGFWKRGTGEVLAKLRPMKDYLDGENKSKVAQGVEIS
jgi:hypothetical protein